MGDKGVLHCFQTHDGCCKRSLTERSPDDRGVNEAQLEKVLSVRLIVSTHHPQRCLFFSCSCALVETVRSDINIAPRYIQPEAFCPPAI